LWIIKNQLFAPTPRQSTTSDDQRNSCASPIMATPQNEAAWLDGKAQKLRVAKADFPKPAADEIVIKNHAIAINPVDWKIQDYAMFIQEWPMVLGTDVAGEVVEVGADVRRFNKGDRVFGHAISLKSQKPENGAFQWYTSVPAVSAAIIPESISYKDATVLPLAIDTAAHGLYAKREDGYLGLPFPSLNPTSSGKTIFVWGGSSSVGAVAIQLATASGAKVVTTASARNHDFVKKLGAAAAIDYNSSSVVEDVVQAIRSVGGDFVGIYDAISESEGSFKHVLPIAEKLGGANVAVVLGAPENAPANVKFGSVFGIQPELNRPIWEEYITIALEQGKFKAVPEALVVGKGLESVQTGLDKNKAGVSAKKVVIEL